MNTRFDLIEIIQALKFKIKYILIITLLGALIGLLFFLFQKKKYMATSQFFVSNPLYIDRGNLYRTDKAQFIDYFASEDDIDKVMAIAKSNTLKSTVIQSAHLSTLYHLDSTNAVDNNKLYKTFSDNYKPVRTENKNMEISYTDPDPNIAAQVVNTAVKEIEHKYSSYFSKIKQQILNSLTKKQNELDSSIKIYTDSLVNLRDQYGIYDIISPNRKATINGNLNKSKGSAKGIELIQNLEAIKDQLVVDKANGLSVYNEFSTGNLPDELPLINVVSEAYPPNSPSGFGMLLTVFTCALVAFIFSACWVLLSDYVKRNLESKA